MVLQFSMKDLREEAEREIRMRRRVFPNRVGSHRMTQALADRQIAMMEAIARLLAELEARDRLL